jgi:hypothetical protein
MLHSVPVEAGRRLVEEHHARVVQEGPGQPDALSLAGRQAIDAPPLERLESEPGEHPLDRAGARPSRDEGQRREELEVLRDREPGVETAVPRREEADPAAVALSLVSRVQAERAHVAVVRGKQSGRDPQQRGLAGAVAPFHEGHLAGLERQVQVFENRVAAEAPRESPRRQRRRVRPRV